LSKHQAQIDCLKLKINLRVLKGEKIIQMWKLRGSGLRFITAIRAKKLLR